jgi:hypothetical protein
MLRNVQRAKMYVPAVQGDRKLSNYTVEMTSLEALNVNTNPFTHLLIINLFTLLGPLKPRSSWADDS